MPEPVPPPLAVAGYVLAGGKSSRMGSDKALVPLSGKPLIEHAVAKLRRICIEVAILSANPQLSEYAPLVPDLHPGCGPIGGIEAALAHSSRDWNLILPVDLPFLPGVFLERWVSACCTSRGGLKLSLFRVGERPQPTLLMVHRDVASSLAGALERGEYQLFQALGAAAGEIADREGRPFGQVIENRTVRAEDADWFANLNTPDDVAAAESRQNLLDLI